MRVITAIQITFMKDVIEKLLRIAEKNPLGFTVRVLTGEEIKSGFVVAYKETQNSFDVDGLKKCVKHALQHEKIIGGWKENNLYYFDSVKVFTDFEKAKKFARENKQIAFFDLDRFETHYL